MYVRMYACMYVCMHARKDTCIRVIDTNLFDTIAAAFNNGLATFDCVPLGPKIVFENSSMYVAEAILEPMRVCMYVCMHVYLTMFPWGL
jgi:hypothetical protein